MKYVKVILTLIFLSLQPIHFAQALEDMSNMNSDTHMSEAQTTAPTMRMSIIKIIDKNSTKEAQIHLTNLKNGKPITLADLKEVHTQKIHLLIIDDSLEDYSHVHPMALSTPGMYSFDWSPKLKNANYKIWADVTPTSTGVQEYVRAELTQIGKPTTAKINKTTVLNKNLDGYNFALQFDNKQLQVGKMIMGKIVVTDHNGKHVTNLEPIMGAFAHIVGFYDDAKTIVHIHPLGAEPTKSSDRSGPTLDFHMIPSRAGFIKLFVQVKINGKEIFAPFGFTVQ